MPMPALPPVFTVPPILMYHRVDVERPADPVGRDLTLTPRQFEAEIRALRSAGLQVISMAQLEQRISSRAPLERVVVLTFDDGYADQYRYAVPILRRYGANATFYIVTGQVGRPRHVTWSELRAMTAQHFDVAAHGVQHDDLSQMDAAQQQYQIETSIAKLRAFVHAPVSSYAYPSGRLNATTLRLVARSGVALAVTTDAAYVLPPENRYEITRLRVSGDWSLAEFCAALAAARRSTHRVAR
jgi:peptidoglycan/xylan/chitin deacetylase (PgdA/CDA1 family)